MKQSSQDPNDFEGTVIKFEYFDKFGHLKIPIYFPLLGNYSNFLDLFTLACEDFEIALDDAYISTGREFLSRHEFDYSLAMFIEQYGLKFLISTGGAAFTNDSTPLTTSQSIFEWMKEIENLDVLLIDFIQDILTEVFSEIKDVASYDEEVKNFILEILSSHIPPFYTGLKKINPRALDDDVSVIEEYIMRLCKVYVHDLYIRVKNSQ